MEKKFFWEPSVMLLSFAKARRSVKSMGALLIGFLVLHGHFLGIKM